MSQIHSEINDNHIVFKDKDGVLHNEMGGLLKGSISTQDLDDRIYKYCHENIMK